MSGKNSVPVVRDPRIRPRDPRTYGPNANQSKESGTTTTSSTNQTASVAKVNSQPSTSDDGNAKKSSSGLRVELHEAASDSPEQVMKRISDWFSALTNSSSSTTAVGIFFRDYHSVQGIPMLHAVFQEYLKIKGDSKVSQEKLLAGLQVIDHMLSTEERELKELKKSMYSSDLMRDLTFFLPTMLFYAGLFLEDENCSRVYELLYTWVKRKFFYTRDTFNYLCRCFDEGQYVRRATMDSIGHFNVNDLSKISEFHSFVQTRVHDLSLLTKEFINRHEGGQQIQRWANRATQSMESMVKNTQLQIDSNVVKEYLRNLPAVKAHAYGILANDLILLAHTFFCSWLIDIRDSKSI